MSRTLTFGRLHVYRGYVFAKPNWGHDEYCNRIPTVHVLGVAFSLWPRNARTIDDGPCKQCRAHFREMGVCEMCGCHPCYCEDRWETEGMNDEQYEAWERHKYPERIFL